MNVLYVSSEVIPFSKTGGLADVAGSLPVYLKKQGLDVRIVTPLYASTYNSNQPLHDFNETISVYAGTTRLDAAVYEASLQDTVRVYLIKNDELFMREGLYGTSGGDYRDNALRFVFFCRAALSLYHITGFAPDIIHCNDWQTGLIPAYIKSKQDNSIHSSPSTVFTIHNIAYQGVFSRENFHLTGLPESYNNMQGLEYYGNINFLKAGIVFADCITAVSETYSREIQTPEYGCGLEGVLQERKSRLYGIINGADYTQWSPDNDHFITVQYNEHSLDNKLQCKRDLLAIYGLSHASLERPLIGMLSRMTVQKGFDILADSVQDIINLGCSLVILGTGEERYHNVFKELEKKYGHRMGVKILYSDAIAHKIEAGCDMFLMPSRYEPCGLNQIYSLKYGTVPIVRATGGLNDTIHDYNECSQSGNGFVFSDCTPASLIDAVYRALEVFGDKKKWLALVRNCMQCDYSWDVSARKYVEVYKQAVEH